MMMLSIKQQLYAICLVSSGALLTGCMTTTSLPDHKRPQHWGSSINPSHNFYQISQDMFRSEQPHAQLIPSLKKYNIQTIINLRSRDRDRDQSTFAGSSFNLVHIPMDTWSINREDLLNVMREIQRANNTISAS